MKLSKSLYTRAIQCQKSLWLKKHNKDVLTPPNAAAQAIFQNGNEVGDLACKLFPNGVEIPFENTTFQDKIILTQLEEFYSEIIRPIYFQGEIIAYPVYEPLKVTDMFLFSSDNEKLISIKEDEYVVNGAARLSDLNDMLGINLESEDFESVGGLIPWNLI